jgi:tetratricopeptide (TPR) repeat protein
LTFKPALTHDVTYGTLLQDRRRALHARIVEAIEALYPDRLAEHAERLAHHALRGEAWAKALGYLRQAGAKAIGRCAYRQAVAYFDDALVALHHVPETRETIEQAIDVRLDLRNAHMPLGEHDRMIEHINAAEPLATALGDRYRLGRVLANMSTNFYIAGDHTRAIDSAERGLAVSAGLQDFGLETELTFRLAIVHLALGNFPRAIELTTRNIDVLTGDRMYRAFTGPLLNATNSRAWLVRALMETGRFTEAMPRAIEAVQIAEAIDHLNSLVVALWGLGVFHLERGDVVEALPVLERAMRLCEAAEIITVSAWLAPCLALAYLLSGRSSEALLLLEQATRYAVKGTGLHAYQAGVTAEGYLRAGRLDDAVKHAERALAISRHAGERGHEARALRLLGDIVAARDPLDAEQADRHYLEALASAEGLGMRPLAAHCHLGLGTLWRRPGQRGQAREHLTTAMSMYREMDMPFWLEQAEIAMTKLRLTRTVRRGARGA